MLEVIKAEGDIIELRADGKIVHEDYERVVPEMERVIAEHGAMRCLLEIGGLTGVTPRALLDDLKFDVKHARDITRCAVVTETPWHEWMTRVWGFVMPRTEIRCFKPAARAEAAAWLRAS